MSNFKEIIPEVKDFLQQSITYLKKNQQQDGSFTSYSWAENTKNTPLKYKSPFPIALIMTCLNSVKELNQVQDILDQGSSYLLSQKSDFYSFNYWDRYSKQSKKLPYPDDLDDTFCSLIALYLYNSNIFTGDSLANIVTVLTNQEVQEGGPYRTWIVSAEKDTLNQWQDVDLAVNSNIAYFLSLLDIQLPNLTAFLDQSISKNDFSSPYYPTIYPVLYFLSRTSVGPDNSKIIATILSQKQLDNSWGNPLNTALCISALINLKYDVLKLEKSISYLQTSQTHDHWLAYPFCYDPSIDKTKFYAGSSFLTTAFCIEALSLYTKYTSERNQIISKKSHIYKNNELRIKNKILNKLTDYFDTLSPQSKELFSQQIDRTLTSKLQDEIILLPYYFSQSLKKHTDTITESVIVDLGLINLYGWISYTIIDDILDKDSSAENLPIALMSLRQLNKVTSQIKLQDFYNYLLNQVDEANVWEAKFCRFDSKMLSRSTPLPNYNDYTTLAQRSLGHAGGPLSVFILLGYDQDSLEFKALESFFNHYLIAKQLNDDSHDWEQDFQRGHLSPIVVLILQQLFKTNSLSLPFTFNNDQNNLSLKTLFWNEIIPQISTIVFSHCDTALKDIAVLKNILELDYLHLLISNVRKPLINSLKERQNVTTFLKSYNPNS